MKSNSFSTQKRRRQLVFVFLAVMILVASQVYKAKNYLDPNTPSFSGNYALKSTESVKSITVVSYNIAFGEDIDQAVVELKEIRSQKGLDILLLQEMDQTGTQHLARQLQLNYVYFPAAVEPTYHKNFGNAVLSRWPIVDAQKLLLPHKSFSNRMSRIATRATIQINGLEVPVYSIHTESVFTMQSFRRDQYTTVLNDSPNAKLVIMGGDFNSFTGAAVRQVTEDFKQAGFVRASEASGASVTKAGIQMSVDHIFAKGFAVVEAGKAADATASDHLPIWVVLSGFNP